MLKYTKRFKKGKRNSYKRLALTKKGAKRLKRNYLFKTRLSKRKYNRYYPSNVTICGDTIDYSDWVLNEGGTWK